jgi:hypothetical protein
MQPAFMEVRIEEAPIAAAHIAEGPIAQQATAEALIAEGIGVQELALVPPPLALRPRVPQRPAATMAHNSPADIILIPLVTERETG